MGGLIILISVLVTSLLFIKDYPNIVPVLFLTLGFGIIGFLDDYLKVVLKRSEGLLPMQKMACQIVVTTSFLAYILIVDNSFLTMMIPFGNGGYCDCKWITIPVLYIAVIGTVNGVNFTDGLDGLATGVTTMVAVFFTVVSIVYAGDSAHHSGCDRGAFGLSALQCTPRAGVYGGHRLPGAWRIRGRFRVYFENALDHPDCGIGLSGGGALRHDSGNLF